MKFSEDVLRAWVSDIICMHLTNRPFNGSTINWPRSWERLRDELVNLLLRMGMKEKWEDVTRPSGRRGRPPNSAPIGPYAHRRISLKNRSKYGDRAWDETHSREGIGGDECIYKTQKRSPKKDRKAGEPDR